MARPDRTTLELGVIGRREEVLAIAASNAHTLTSALLLTGAGSLYLILPGALSAGAVGLIDPGFSLLWAIGLVLGGLGTVWGVFRDLARTQIIGLCLLGSSVTFAALAVYDTGLPQAPPAFLIYLSSGLSCYARAWGVSYLERVRARIADDAANVTTSTRP